MSGLLLQPFTAAEIENGGREKYDGECDECRVRHAILLALGGAGK